jgi:hypothetical protein
MSMQKRILDALQTTLASACPWAKTIDFERVRLFSTDFGDHELPCIQIYDVGDRSTNQQGRDSVVWTLAVELVMKKNVDEVVDQGLLFDRRLEIKKAIGADPTLGLQNPGVPTTEGRMIHVRYASGATDLHVLDNHYLARLIFEAMFEEPFYS